MKIKNILKLLTNLCLLNSDLHSVISFLLSPRRYSSGWALASWAICLHSSPSEADYLVSAQFSFYGVRLLASLPTPNLEDQGVPICLAPPLDLSGIDAPTSSYATTGIALRFSGAPKPHRHSKVETPSVGALYYMESINFEFYRLGSNAA
jgi:hypothetical protein